MSTFLAIVFPQTDLKPNRRICRIKRIFTIEDLAVYASILYELREADFYEIAQRSKVEAVAGDDNRPEEDDKWTRSVKAFETLKVRIAAAPILRHFASNKQPVVVVYASKWTISAALMQEQDGTYQPVTFANRTLKPREINYA
ncbi:hypothetical protein L917_03353 [Phytophthora nicotianae]|uniref:Reverse transcriptase/retrotransposon-derived protein RNase H-like domain-containing protein n=2 Tax=Phytophthora nicotianae TaxID=4792 RepID=V9FPR4_PHYNI|nr:hypothetical protein F443_03591 [Phytophthora nicotianae P1569]ETL99886.1 hypothetical protein L917_03353 [Phytophthora nicotianae]